MNDVKVELVKLDEIPELVGRILAVADPEHWESVSANLERHDARGLGPGIHVIDGKPTRVPSRSGVLAANLESRLTKLNRELNKKRWEGYADDMVARKWWTTPDPISITSDGQIINGQHRLRAALALEFEGDETDLPEFVVVWGIDPKAALIMDEARRTANDRRDIAIRFAESA